MREQILDGKAHFLELFAKQLTLLAISNGLNTWNDRQFNNLLLIHQNTAKWN